jgi:dGTP triphosphohydrolase
MERRLEEERARQVEAERRVKAAEDAVKQQLREAEKGVTAKIMSLESERRKVAAEQVELREERAALEERLRDLQAAVDAENETLSRWHTLNRGLFMTFSTD